MSIDRGGLVTPSDLTYIVCIYSLQLQEEVLNGCEAQNLFLSLNYPRAVFVKALLTLIDITPAIESLLDQKCDMLHSFKLYVPKIAEKFFNCM